jgi:8-oxo-dGTP diphosphatase
VDLVREWTGRKACALQAALRETNDSFAARLGIPARTVVSWHQKPDLKPRTAQQQLLDVLLERASPNERARFAAELADESSNDQLDDPTGSGHALRVAVAVVVDDTNVLVVQRRDDSGNMSWQFPAGMIKPGVSPETVAVRETLGETAVHCRVVRHLGGRLHPVTNVYCVYLLCEYLGGEAQNMDVAENVSVTWTPSNRLTRFIPAERIFPPILEALEVLDSE